MFFDPFSSLFSAFPEVDLAETNSHFYVAASIPQVEKESVKIVSEDDRTICISGIRNTIPFYTREEGGTEDKKNQLNKMSDYRILSQERSSGQFRRCFRFSSAINLPEIKAEMKKEELFLTIPKGKIVHKEVSIVEDNSERI